MDQLQSASRARAGRPKPALVLSRRSYNAAAGLMVACPLTTRIKSYPFEVPVAGDPVSVVLVDHVRSLDWRARSAALKTRAASAEVELVRATLAALLMLGDD